MNNKGFIKMYRDIWQESWAKNSCTVHLFFWLATNANVEDNEYEGLKIQRGQLLTSIRSLSKQTGISEQSIRTALKQLCLTHHITQGVTQWVTQGLTHPITHSGTLVSICNYDRYSGFLNEPNTLSNTPSNTGSNTPSNTQPNNDIRNNKEYKEENKEIVIESVVVSNEQQTLPSPTKEKKRRSSVFVKPTLEECTAYANEKGFNWDVTRFYNYYESNGWRVGRNPMKNWKAAMSNWNTKEPKYPQQSLFPTTNSNQILINNNNYDTGTSGNAELDSQLAAARAMGRINKNTEYAAKLQYAVCSEAEANFQRKLDELKRNEELSGGGQEELPYLDIYQDN